ncbi:leucine-rich repeat protein SHOC-2 isoform X2 [Episyrphus balteatus]|uniref:leucine-rich repeat protein SHOC-2 isoform X2 n=1 Tax=Episyrphus balteatus TaxID=286459 RepID=UPI0024862538|nr:leucine-rich repeat protein SHOC-2 isoform X2 [Episyrphus balteatus]
MGKYKNDSQNYSKAFPSSNQTNSSDYNYDDYYDEDDKIITPPPSTTKKPTSKNFLTELFDSALSESNQSLDREEDLLTKSNETPKCPNDCICRNDNKNISCSGMDLTSIPTDIPPTAVILDLSHNKISEIPVGVFSSNKKLMEINLDSNMITHIDKEVFNSLSNLDRLSLANNKLTDISADTFSDATELRVLNLSNNSIILPKEGSFLNQPALRELLLRNSSLTEIYDETFANLSGLHTLKMDGNFFDKKINTKAFQPLKELIKLKLPELKEDNIQELCNILKAIDNISLKRFDISCYQLVNGDTFNQSLIAVTDAPSLKPSTSKFAFFYCSPLFFSCPLSDCVGMRDRGGYNQFNCFKLLFLFLRYDSYFQANPDKVSHRISCDDECQFNRVGQCQ